MQENKVSQSSKFSHNLDPEAEAGARVIEGKAKDPLILSKLLIHYF